MAKWCFPTTVFVVLLGINLFVSLAVDGASPPLMTAIEKEYAQQLGELQLQSHEAEKLGASSEVLESLREKRSRIVHEWLQYIKRSNRMSY